MFYICKEDYSSVKYFKAAEIALRFNAFRNCEINVGYGSGYCFL